MIIINLNEINIGRKVNIKRIDSEGKPLENMPNDLSSKIETNDGRNFEIVCPVENNAPFLPDRGSLLNITFVWNVDRFNLDQYSFNAEVISIVKGETENSLPVIKLKPVTPVERIFKRSFFRFDYNLKFSYRLIKEEATEEKFTDTHTKDISGGGICTYTKHKMEKDQLGEGELKLNANYTCKFIFKVLWSKMRDDYSEKENMPYETGLVFENIKEHDRDMIIAFIFNEQRRLRQKGMI